jgi:predicted ester cyclase
MIKYECVAVNEAGTSDDASRLNSVLGGPVLGYEDFPNACGSRRREMIMRRLVTACITALCVPSTIPADAAGIEEADRRAFVECTKQENVDTSCWADGEVINHGRKVPIDRIKAVLEDLRRAFPDGKTEILDVAFDGDTVATRIIFRGTHTGVATLPVMSGLLAGLPPTGKRVEFQAMHWFKVRDGKIIAHYAVREDLSIARQLGLLPSPQPAPVPVQPPQ